MPTPRAIEAHTARELESGGVDTVPQLQPQVEAQRPRALGAAHTAATSSQQLRVRVRVALLRVHNKALAFAWARFSSSGCRWGHGDVTFPELCVLRGGLVALMFVYAGTGHGRLVALDLLTLV